jgi:putative spermidine/putrescine transport system ATP-binding protein
VAVVIYAGPTTRIVAIAPPGVTLTATVLTASTWLPLNVDHGAPITLAWKESAVHHLDG